MQSLCLATAKLGSKSSPASCFRHRHGPEHASVAVASPVGASLFNPPLRLERLGMGMGMVTEKRRIQKRGSSAVCQASLGLHPRTLQWVSSVCTAILMLTKGTAINKSYLVPLFALQAPGSVIGWIQGDYGTWTAFLALLVRLFFFIPGELELPSMTLLLVIVAPYQAMNLRGTQPGYIISLALAGYMAFQHFSREGSLKRAFSQGGIVASSAIILVTVISLLLFI